MQLAFRQNAFCPQDVGGRLKGPGGSAGSPRWAFSQAHSRAPPAGSLQEHIAYSSLRFTTSSRPFKAPDVPASWLLRMQTRTENRACFRLLSVGPQALRSCRHPFSCLIYFILKGLSIRITRTAWKRVSDVCQVRFLVLLIVRNNRLPLRGHTPAPLHGPPRPLLAFPCRRPHLRGMGSI